LIVVDSARAKYGDQLHFGMDWKVIKITFCNGITAKKYEKNIQR